MEQRTNIKYIIISSCSVHISGGYCGELGKGWLHLAHDLRSGMLRCGDDACRRSQVGVVLMLVGSRGLGGARATLCWVLQKDFH